MISKLTEFLGEKRLNSILETQGYLNYYYDDETEEEYEAPFNIQEYIEYLKDTDDAEGAIEFISQVVYFMSYDEIKRFCFYCGYQNDILRDLQDDDYISDEARKEIIDILNKDTKEAKADLDLALLNNTSTTTLTYNQVEDEVLDFVGDLVDSSEWCERGYILRNGEYLSNNSLLGNHNNSRHGDADKVIMQELKTRLKVSEADIRKALKISTTYDANGSGGSLIGDSLGWIRINGGAEQYVCLPEKKPTREQLYLLEDWISEFIINKSSPLKVTDADGRQVSYYFDGNSSKNIEPFDADYIIQKIKKYYNTGNLEEKVLNEKLYTLEPGMFITNSPREILNLLQNKPKIYRILYDRNIDQYMICDANDWVHYDMILAANNYGYYYNFEDFIDKIGTIENYIEYGQGGQFIDTDDGEEEVDMYLYYLIFVPNKCDDASSYTSSDGYDKEYRGNIGTMYSRGCDFKEIDLYDYFITANISSKN